MGFIQTAFLGALAAVAIPVVIHLIFRRRARRVDLGTVRFLRIVLHQNARRRRVQRWALLVLRMACVALLALSFARPYLLATQRSGKDRFVAVLIDRSASMAVEDRGGRLLDQAIAQARALVGGSRADTQVEVAFFDQAVHPVRESAGRLEAPQKTYTATDYGAALAWARDLCIKSPHGRKEVHLFTDLQRSGMDFTAPEPLPEEVEFHLHDFGPAVPNNVGVTGARPPRTLIRPGETVTVAATVFNAGPFPLEKVPVVLTLESERRRHRVSEEVTLPPGGTVTVDFEAPGLDAGLWRGTVAVEANDDLPFDNRRHLAVMAAPRLRTVLLDGDHDSGPLLSETYFLETALRLAPPGQTDPESAFEPTVAAADGLPDLSRADLVVLANVPNLTPADARRLGQFVARGGGLMVFTGDQVTADACAALADAGLSAGRIAGIARASDLPARLWEWDEQHPLFQPFDDPQHGDLRRLAFYSHTQIEPAADARVLARFRGGDPALIERRHGKGRVLWFASAADGQWGNWTRSRLYLPLMHQMLGYLAGLAEGGPVRDAVVDAADVSEPGVYDRDGYWLVVNPSPRESETDRCTPDDFAERFQLGLDDADAAHQSSAGPQRAASMELRDDEIWYWAVLALAGLLIVEALVANRTTA